MEEGDGIKQIYKVRKEFKMKKLAVIGAGNAGCITALHFQQHLPDLEIDLYHDSEHHPIERVGQGTTTDVTMLLSQTLDLSWWNNPIGATIKTGILYKNWGTKNRCFFHDFNSMGQVGIHYTPKKLSDAVLSSGKFNIKEQEVNDPEAEIDSDFIIDCRGRNARDKDKLDPIINPINSVLLGSVTDDCSKNILEYHDIKDLKFTEAQATPNGWTFIIPSVVETDMGNPKDVINLGYLYNSDITSKENATKDFQERFGVEEIEHSMKFDNYCSNNPFVGERTLLNGNQCAFIEPLESTATGLYLWIARVGFDRFINNAPTNECIELIHNRVGSIGDFVLWHYKTGSIFNSPFWESVKHIPFVPIQKPIGEETYGVWGRKSFDTWENNTEDITKNTLAPEWIGHGQRVNQIGNE